MGLFDFLKSGKNTNEETVERLEETANPTVATDIIEDESPKTDNSKQRFIYNLIILDESGSMASIQHTIISGFNELVQSIKGVAQQYPEQEHYISFISFNGMGIKTIHDCVPITKLQEIDASRYNPNSMTPLYDAIGFGIQQLQGRLSGKQDYNVLVTIMTDGLENDSKEFSIKTIKKMIEELKKRNWTFTYIGTDHDIESVADSLSISNRMRFEKSEEDMKNMFEKERYSRQEYHRNISRDESYYQEDYYGEKRGGSRFLQPNKQHFNTALNEIKNGHKTGHWMWFMFPQIQGLGYSDVSKFYAIRDLDEASLFAREFPTGEHLKILCEELLKLPETDATVIFGSVDAMKLRSSMALFSMTRGADPVYQQVLDKFFNGQKDERTIEIINNQKNRN